MKVGFFFFLKLCSYGVVFNNVFMLAQSDSDMKYCILDESGKDVIFQVKFVFIILA